MFLKRPKSLAYFFLVGAVFFWVISSFVVVHTEIGMQASACSSPVTALCMMNPLEHLAAWQGLFIAYPQISNMISFLIAFFALIIIGFRRVRSSHVIQQFFLKQKYRTIRARSVPVTTFLQEAFSMGILNPKIF